VVPRRRERPPNGSFRHPCHRPCRAGSLLHSRMQYWIRISNILRTNNKLVCAQLDVELTNVEMNSRVKECKCPGGFSVHSLPTPTLRFATPNSHVANHSTIVQSHPLFLPGFKPAQPCAFSFPRRMASGLPAGSSVQRATSRCAPALSCSHGHCMHGSGTTACE
jgi:hypothetical protein